MPIYEYTCATCGVSFEKRQSFNDAPVTEYANCPNNQEGCQINRLISPPAIVFKGTGFYINDSKDSNGTGKKSESKEPEKKSEAKSETKSETKSEGKSETKSETSSKND